MAITKLDIRQAVNRIKLDQLFNILPSGGKEVDDILSDINDDLTPPLRLMGTIPASLVLSVESIFKMTNDTGKRKTIPPISNLLPNFTSGTITFPASSGGTVTVSPGFNTTLTLGVGEYIKCGVNLDANGNLNLMFGTAGASEDLATVPPTIDGTFAIGYVVLHNVGGVIQNFGNSQIVQYVGGGGGGSGGNASEDLESLKNTLMDSSYELLSYNIFKLDADNKIDGSSTGSYSLVTKTFDLDSGETLVSQQLLDVDEFLSQGKDVGEIDLQVFWSTGLVDTAATYEVSRDGGVNWQTASLDRIGTTRSYVGTHIFAEESSFSDLFTQASAAAQTSINAAQPKIGQIFTVTSPCVLKTASFPVTKAGSPSGYLYVDIVNQSAGAPSEASSDRLYSSIAKAASSVASGSSTISFNLNVVLPAGNYAVVVRGDTTFTGSVDGSNYIMFNNAIVDNGLSTFNGTSWTVDGARKMTYTLSGRVLDLRVRITASANTKSLDGFGVFYDNQPGNIVTGYKNIEVFKFKAVADNDNEFTLTRFIPDPELLKCFYVEGGQTFIRPAFELQGSKIVFPVDTFNNGGVEADVTLIFQQLEGSSFDNSDANALLLSENHLGSQDATLDRSVNGRGILLRRPDGTLRELTIDNNDAITIKEV